MNLNFLNQDAYILIARLQLIAPNIFNERLSNIDTYYNTQDHIMVQAHNAQNIYRVRQAPTEAKPFPEYGPWVKVG